MQFTVLNRKHHKGILEGLLSSAYHVNHFTNQSCLDVGKAICTAINVKGKQTFLCKFVVKILRRDWKDVRPTLGEVKVCRRFEWRTTLFRRGRFGNLPE